MRILAILFIFSYSFIIKILFFHRHNSLQKQSLGIKSKQWISGHVCKLLLTLFSNSNNSNRAMFLFVQTPFDVAK